MKSEKEKPYQMLQDSLTSKEGKEDAEAYSALMQRGTETPDDEVARMMQQAFDEVDQKRNNTTASDLSEN
jgi:hypothetical protein